MVPLLANAGTPLIWLSFFHLVVGNAFVALGEAWLLQLIWKVPARRAFPWMALANYATMALGAFAMSAVGSAWADDLATPFEIRTVLLVAGATLFVVTVFGEWVCVARALDGRFRPTRRTLGASLVLQMASYAVLIPMYVNGSSIAAVAQTTPVAATEIAGDLAARIYYIAESGAVRSMALDGSDDRDESDPQTAANGWIVAEPADGTLRLQDRATAWSTHVDGRIERFRNINGHGLAANPAGDERWHVSAGFWSVEGLRVRDEATGERYNLGLETPFVSWSSRSATLLPGGRAVYALGPHIVLLDLSTRRIAHLARGRGPVVVLEETP